MTPEERARSIKCPTHGPHDHDLCVAAAIREAEDAKLEEAALGVEAAEPFIGKEWATQLAKDIRGLKSSAASG